MPKRRRLETEELRESDAVAAISSGGVVLDGAEPDLLVALVIPKHRHVWCLPKGTVELGETYPAAALREVREETGLEAEILQSLDSIQYTFLSPRRIRVNKTVHYYLMRRVGGDVSLHDHEMAEVHLVPLQEAVRMLEYPNERSVLERALAVVDAAG